MAGKKKLQSCWVWLHQRSLHSLWKPDFSSFQSFTLCEHEWLHDWDTVRQTHIYQGQPLPASLASIYLNDPLPVTGSYLTQLTKTLGQLEFPADITKHTFLMNHNTRFFTSFPWNFFSFLTSCWFPFNYTDKPPPPTSTLDSFTTTIFIANWPMELIQHITLFFFPFWPQSISPHAHVSLAPCISSHPISSQCWIACSRTSNFNLNKRWSISLANCLWQHQQFESKGFIGNSKGILTHPHHVVGTYCLLC